ncbi:Uncharacterized protein PECH_004862 [Penicillium ucsense]|uniref:Uncharacterized protein n=1 Tax=Penicillium ucsense TaxID=2839758 RepID=A0A8J8WAB4_9EURO|nr:Uncharacterized protein PECM_006967 [Penicillium ucsense]KAF7736797.1 Uncharacterized protein PECH_004862 [Penicillium ucsense]
MVLSTLSNTSWVTIGLLGFAAVSPVYAFPAQPAITERAQLAPAIEARDPRLIPDTEAYLANLFDLLGMSIDISSTPGTTLTPTPTTSASSTASPTISSTDNMTDDSRVHDDKDARPTPMPAPVVENVGFITSANVQHGDDKPIQNVQIGPGYQGGKKLEVSDLPVIFAAVETEVAARLRKAWDSSDEVGLTDPLGH